MHTDYLNLCFRDLRDQLIRAASFEQLVEAADRAELMLREIEPSGGYHCQDVGCQLVTSQCVLPPAITISGEAAEHDLRRLIEDLTDAADLSAEASSQPIYTIDQLSTLFDVSKKTIARWRKQGLVSRRFVMEGRKRVGFL